MANNNCLIRSKITKKMNAQQKNSVISQFSDKITRVSDKITSFADMILNSFNGC